MAKRNGAAKANGRDGTSLQSIFEAYRRVNQCRATKATEQTRVKEAKANWEAAKGDLKEANEELVAAQDELMDLIGELAGEPKVKDSEAA